MNDQVFDVSILGGGVAGAFAAYRLAGNKNLKVCLIEFGRPPGKRRKQLEGWCGAFMSGNGRLFCTNDFLKVKDISGVKETVAANNKILPLFKSNGSHIESKNKEPNDVIKKLLKKNGYSLTMNNFIQWKQESIHALSKEIADYIVEKNNVEMMFDTEVFDVSKENNIFIIKTENGTIKAKKVLFCLGRSGWRFANTIYNKLSILKADNSSYFGFRGEISASYLKDWNECHCTIQKKNIQIGPMSWHGTIIPEDHDDLVISSWRSNEDRWHSDKAAFSVIFKTEFENKGSYQTERLSKLAYILCDNRIGKIKIKEFLSTSNDLHLIPEYDWLNNEIKEINKIMPHFIEKGHIYFPDIITHQHTININKDFSTDCEGFYVAGESAGISGIYAAALSGTVVANNIVK